MTFSTWIERQPRGTLEKLHRSTGLGRVTLWRAQRGEAVSYRTAVAISTATGGVVSIHELCTPSTEAA